MQKITVEDRLNNLISFVSHIIEARQPKEARDSALFALVKMFADKISYERVIDVITTPKGIEHGFYFFWTLMGADTSVFDLDEFKCLETNLDGIAEVLEIDLVRDAVIPSVQKAAKVRDTLLKMGTMKNAWQEQKDEHSLLLYLPLGVCFVYSGNHSINCGMIKKQGKITIPFNLGRHYAFDVSDLLRNVYFDGVNYKRLSDDNVLFPAANFEFGCLFEIGRLMDFHGISFVDYKKSQAL